MKELLLTVSLFLGVSMSGGAQYRNPVIPGYHPDPSAVRVGNDYYIVNSSFEYFPGVPIFHSRDMVNWQQIGNVLDRESQLPLEDATSWTGIYAPTIRYNDGVYYVITTNVGKGGNFMVTATNPAGPWSDPIWLDQQGIDPSLYFEDGKCYMVSNPDNTIMLCRIDPTTGKRLTPSRPLWQGTGGRYPEGPHLYKKDGYYYLLISEGGTEMAHRLTIARSRNIEGPYEANPRNPLLTHCSLAGQTSNIQGTGHGDFFQAADGSWWIVFLAYRNFEGAYHHLGRETYMAPVEWKTGEWPVVNGDKPVDTLMNVKMPVAAGLQQPRHIRTTFGQPLGPEWVYIQNPDKKKYRRVNHRLRLTPSRSSLTENKKPTFVGRRQEAADFTAETRVDFAKGQPGNEAGLTVYQINDGHTDFFLMPTDNGMQVALKVTLKSLSVVKKAVPITGTTCRLRVRSDGKYYYFEYATGNDHFRQMDKIDCALMSTEVVGGFTGVILGIYATQNGENVSSVTPYADFEYFEYEEK
jgi:xylan 1,4-beta-xylosidase